MITLSELFNDLAYGEFTNISIGKSDLDTIREEKYPNIVSAINLGLIELCKRFNLVRKEVDLHQQSDGKIYYLRSDYIADSANEVASDAYLVEDEEMPFQDDLLKIMEAYDSSGEKVYVNDANYPYDLFNLAPDMLKFVQEEGEALRVVTLLYRASYPKIVIDDDFDPDEIILYIPDYIRGALLLYVAHRIFMGKTSKLAEGETNLSTTFLLQFNNTCNQLKLDNLIEVVSDEDSRFRNNGWI